VTPSEFEVLVSLAGGEKHGYAIMTEAGVGAGTLYTMLDRLMTEGVVEQSARKPEPDEDQRRRYYKLTRSGRRALTDEVARLEGRLRAARRRVTQNA